MKMNVCKIIIIIFIRFVSTVSTNSSKINVRPHGLMIEKPFNENISAIFEQDHVKLFKFLKTKLLLLLVVSFYCTRNSTNLID